jgi:hypothetical protein
MRLIDSISIGSTPCDEDCAQLGSENYTERARKECAAFIHQIRRVMGEEPVGARLRIKGNPHDFGTYYDVECVYEMDDEAAQEYALKCEGSSELTRWDETALTELGLKAVQA